MLSRIDQQVPNMPPEIQPPINRIVPGEAQEMTPMELRSLTVIASASLPTRTEIESRMRELLATDLELSVSAKQTSLRVRLFLRLAEVFGIPVCSCYSLPNGKLQPRAPLARRLEVFVSAFIPLRSHKIAQLKTLRMTPKTPSLSDFFAS